MNIMECTDYIKEIYMYASPTSFMSIFRDIIVVIFICACVFFLIGTITFKPTFKSTGYALLALFVITMAVFGITYSTKYFRYSADNYDDYKKYIVDIDHDAGEDRAKVILSIDDRLYSIVAYNGGTELSDNPRIEVSCEEGNLTITKYVNYDGDYVKKGLPLVIS